MEKEKLFRAAKLLRVNPAVLMSDIDYTTEQIQQIINFFVYLEKTESPHTASIQSLLEVAAKE